MLKRIRLEASRKSGSKITILLPDGEQLKASSLTILGPSWLTTASEFIWLETTDKLIVDGVEVA